MTPPVVAPNAPPVPAAAPLPAGRAAEDRRVVAGLALLIALAAGLLYVRILGHGFVNYDDPVYLTENPGVLGGLSWEGLRWAFGIHGPSMWIPLTWLSHQAVVSFAGLDPAAHHGVNLALHAANAALAFLVWRRLAGGLWRPAFVGAALAVHPLHVESVAWATERKDVLALFFLLLTVYCYAGYARAPSRRRWLGVTVLGALAVMAKPLAVTLPCLLLLLDAWPLGRLRLWRTAAGAVAWGATWRQAWPCVREKLPWCAGVAVACWLTILCQRSIHAIGSLEVFPLARRVANAAAAYGAALADTIWPRDLAVFYPYPAQVAISAWVPGALALALGAVLAWRYRRTAPWAGVGLAWFAGAYVPMIGLVQAGAAARADRYAYLPHLGLYVLLAWGAAALARRGPGWRRGVCAVLGLALVGWGAVAWRQVGVWRDSETLFTHAIAATGPNPLAATNLGMAARTAGRMEEAERWFTRVVELDPGYYEGLNNLGIQRAEAGALEEGRGWFERAIARKPHDPRAWLNLGRAWLQSGEPARAEAFFRAALDRDPTLAAAHLHLGLAREALGDAAGARAAWGEALRHDPGMTKVRELLAAPGKPGPAEVGEGSGSAAAERAAGVSARLRGDPTEAGRRLLAALALAPDDAATHFELGLLYGGIGDHATAARAFAEALRLRPGWAEAAENLRRAQAAGGQSMAP